MFVYDAMTRMKNNIEKRERRRNIMYALKAGGFAFLATGLGFFVWLGLLMVWTWNWN